MLCVASSETLLGYLADKKFDLITNLLTALLGFLAALIFNGELGRRRERNEFKNLLHLIATEAINNRAVLDESFLKNLNGIITRPLMTVCTESAITSPLFVRYADKTNREIITKYYRQLVLLNGNRQFHYDLALISDEKNLKTWMPGLIEIMTKRIEDGKKLIDEVSAIAK